MAPLNSLGIYGATADILPPSCYPLPGNIVNNPGVKFSVFVNSHMTWDGVIISALLVSGNLINCHLAPPFLELKLTGFHQSVPHLPQLNPTLH